MLSTTNRRMFLKKSGLVTAACALGAGRARPAEAAVEMPMVPLGQLTSSRFIIGGNPFSGNSHQPGDVSRQMADWYTTDRIKRTLEQAADEGVNTFLGRGDKHIQRVMREYWNEGGRIKNWIAQSAPEYGDMNRNVREVAGIGGRGMYIQGAHIDRLYAEGRLDEARPWVDEIRNRGMAAGVGSHRPDVLRIVQDKGWPVDFYMQCFYNLSENGEAYKPDDPLKAVATIRELEKPTIAFKILAAGRNAPDESFDFAFSNIKPTDSVCVGIFAKHRPDEVCQDAELTRKYGR